MSNQTLDREAALAKAKELGIVHDKRAKTKAIIKMITDLSGETFEEKAVEKPVTEGTTRCIIHSNDRDNDEVEMTVGLNGEMLQIQIGEEVQLPNKYIGVIKCASIKRTTSVLNEDGEPTGKRKVRMEPRYIIEKV